MGDEGHNEAAPGADTRTPPAGAFVAVARVGEVAVGRLRRVLLGDRLICLANVDGQLYALDDDCPHIGAALSQGALDGATLTCPLHLAQFDVRSGHVTRGPARANARVYAIRIEGERILVADPDTPAE